MVGGRGELQLSNISYFSNGALAAQSLRSDGYTHSSARRTRLQGTRPGFSGLCARASASAPEALRQPQRSGHAPEGRPRPRAPTVHA